MARNRTPSEDRNRKGAQIGRPRGESRSRSRTAGAGENMPENPGTHEGLVDKAGEGEAFVSDPTPAAEGMWRPQCAPRCRRRRKSKPCDENALARHSRSPTVAIKSGGDALERRSRSPLAAKAKSLESALERLKPAPWRGRASEEAATRDVRPCEETKSAKMKTEAPGTTERDLEPPLGYSVSPRLAGLELASARGESDCEGVPRAVTEEGEGVPVPVSNLNAAHDEGTAVTVAEEGEASGAVSILFTTIAERARGAAATGRNKERHEDEEKEEKKGSRGGVSEEEERQKSVGELIEIFEKDGTESANNREMKRRWKDKERLKKSAEEVEEKAQETMNTASTETAAKKLKKASNDESEEQSAAKGPDPPEYDHHKKDKDPVGIDIPTGRVRYNPEGPVVRWGSI